jgi:hypothetical protein
MVGDIIADSRATSPGIRKQATFAEIRHRISLAEALQSERLIKAAK